MKRQRFYSSVFLGIFVMLVCSSCADETVDVAFNLTFESEAVRTLALTGTTARIWYRYSRLGDSIRFQPNQALPSQESVTPGADGAAQTRSEFSTASKAGFSVSSGSSIFLKNLLLNQAETEVGVEFLKTLSDGGIYVVAYGVYRPSTAALSKEQLSADATAGMIIYAGRSCGRCNEQEAIAPNAAESFFKERCGSGVNPLRTCATYE